MAAIVATDITDIDSWRVNRMGKPALYHRMVAIALSSNGGTADDIPASLLGFKTIYEARSIRYVVTSGSALKSVPVVVEADNAGILTINTADSTDSTRSAPANVVSAGTLTVLIVGLEAN